MGVYLGSDGRVILSRSGGKQPLLFELSNSDINVSRRRFAVPASGAQFITGDQIEILTLPANQEIDLELTPEHKDDDGNLYNSYRGYVHVDALGGIRLYKNFSDAIRGDCNAAEVLGEFSNAANKQLISIRVVPQSAKKCLAGIRDFEITTVRENIDTTCLSNRYRQEYEDGLIQGQGTINCLWDAPSDCENTDVGDAEFAEYLAQLCIRLVQGCDFHGYFYLYYGGDTDEKSTWYECADCLVTNVATSVEPTQVINSQIQFITSGPIVLRHGYPPSFLIQEDASAGQILQEDGDGLVLNNPIDDCT